MKQANSGLGNFLVLWGFLILTVAGGTFAVDVAVNQSRIISYIGKMIAGG